MNRHLLIAFAFTISLAPGARAYDEVKVKSTLALADKKAEPTLLRFDPSGAAWTVNAGVDAIQKISDQGTVAVSVATGKKGAIKEVADFTFMANGAMAVADAGAKKILILENKATDKKSEWKKPAVVAQFDVDKPACLAVSGDRIVAVAYAGEPVIDLFSLEGVQLHRLSALEKDAIDQINRVAFAADGTLWALDARKGKLHRWAADRKYKGATEGLEGATDLSVDPFGFAYVSIEKGKWKEVNPAGAVTGTFGSKGKEPGQMASPVGIAADGERVWVAEAGNHRLQIFNVKNREKQNRLLSGPAAFIQVKLEGVRKDPLESLVYLPNGEAIARRPKNIIEHLSKDGKGTAWKKKSKKEAGVGNPSSFAVDAAGKLWVSDQSDDTIKQVSADGAIAATLGKKGKKEGSLSHPSFLSVRPDGSVVVADRGDSRVQVLGKDGLYLFSVGKSGKLAGQFKTVTGMAANAKTIAILDADRNALLFFDSTGKFMSEVANVENQTAYWTKPVALASDAQGRFYVLDPGAHRVRAFDADGLFLADFSITGRGLACGPDGKVAVIDEKQTSVYQVHFVPHALAKVNVEDQSGNIAVSWDASGEAASYRVYRSSVDGSFTLVGSTSGVTLTDSDTTPATKYVYAVAGVGDGGHEGAWTASQPIKASRRKDVSLVSIDSVNLRPVFTAAFKYYVKTPVGEVVIHNNDDKPFRNVKLSLTVAKYCDFPTETTIPEIGAGQKVTVPVTLTLNEKVLELTENTPVQADAHVVYFEDNKEKDISQNAPITLYSRNAISWMDKARIASFVTPRDTPIVEFARAGIRAYVGTLKGSTVTKPLAKAALFYESVNALGITYVPDPTSPISMVLGKPDAIDYVQFPRETLRRKTGDCDDTTALMSALLESIGVHTAAVYVPGHILLMADTEETDPTVIGLPEERFVQYQGTYWVPIETTQFGNGKDFLAAWQSAIGLIRAAEAKNEAEFVPMADASAVYAPVTLVDADPNTPAFPEDKVKTSFPAILAKLQKERFEAKLDHIQQEIKAKPDDRFLQIELGMVYAEGGKADDARKIFESLMKPEESAEIRASAQNNIGNLDYLAGDYKGAAAAYAEAAQLAPDDGGILVNQARAAWRLGDKDKARAFALDGEKRLKDWREYAGDLPGELLPK
ncbi:MAG: hypothetical protein JO102_01230 [Elusimicrobia bacterium]|nr:hypothetical protein [Elusimicrobiota bacterium]